LRSAPTGEARTGKPFALEKRSYRRDKNRKTFRACEALLQEKQEKPFALEKRSYRAFF
jgi:hypothetical protein